MENSATSILYCQDRKGLVFVIARFLLQHGGNILHADQHQDAELGLFFNHRLNKVFIAIGKTRSRAAVWQEIPGKH